MPVDRYVLTFSTDSDLPDSVVVHRTGAVGPGGNPVYSDDTGIVRAEISQSGELRMLASGAQQSLRRPIAVRRVEEPG